ncbi:hypothetical protein MCAG_03863 [Micromonospora sp. ATCC 39149]|uniref:hypothetical protein n=1 Tax=Micromonospora sp. (strain ATCC 39149 / NRRL 15099 / SCC 1413) TaxID=219305 RepID=UPI0001A50598|nr:hypothetical protein [Micromonospora sp. ATCC 39149]EEP73536.1 hypothetical protein MCAG_03863 [Micromonospora sp. ATCC 39149]
MSALLIAALSALVAALLIALGVASLLAWAYRTAADDAAEERDDLRQDLRDAHRTERGLRADLATTRAELHALRRTAATPDEPADPATPRWALRTLRDIHLTTTPADFDTPGSTR